MDGAECPSLREAESTPEADGWRLADRRVESTRRMLTERAGIEPGPLHQREEPIPLVRPAREE